MLNQHLQIDDSQSISLSHVDLKLKRKLKTDQPKKDTLKKIEPTRKLPKHEPKLGGIGAANIGTENWNEKTALYQKMKDYSQNS